MKFKPLDKLAKTRMYLNGPVVLACGCFDLLHIGHIKHLQAAKKLGRWLMVLVTHDEHVKKGPNRPAFPHDLRAEALSALEVVDYVTINDDPNAVKAIKALRPNIYVKGPDYREGMTPALIEEKQIVEQIGGQFAFTDDIVFHSTNLVRHLG